MRRIVIILLIVAGLGFLFSRNLQHNATPASVSNPASASAVAGPEHDAITNMALQSEAKAKQAASIASTDSVAEYEKNQAEQ